MVQHLVIITRFLLASILFSACQSKIKVDSIFYNAQVYSVDSANTKHQAFAVNAGKIVFTGTTANVLAKYESANMFDVKNKFIYPGFNDAHCHFVGYAGDMYKCQLMFTKSFANIIDSLKKYDSTNELNFIYGRGWDQNNWAIKQFPNNELLNVTFPNKAVFLKRIDGHAVLINKYLWQQAQQVLLPFKNTSFIETKNGKPTGILFDNAMEEVEKLLPKISKKILIKNILRAQQECFKLGITSITEAGLNYDDILLIDSLQKAGSLAININVMVSATKQNIDYLLLHPFAKSKKLSINALKVYVDGALGSRGACLKKPYSDEVTNYGRLNITLRFLDSIANWALQNNFQMCAHAIGDSANAVVLKTFAKYLKGKNNKRWRVEHAQVIDEKDIHYFYDNSIIASVQPTHATSDMQWAFERLGAKRIKTAYAYGTIATNKINIALGTDFPVEYFNPLYTFYAATSRQDANRLPIGGFQKFDALNRIQTLRGMTIDAAYAGFNDKNYGSIENSKYADFIIADFDLMHDDLLQIRNSKIFSVYINGFKY